MDKQEFLNVKLEQITQVYSGRRDCCRCGCGGDYVSSSYAKPTTWATVNDSLVQRRLNRAKKLVEQGAEFDSDTIYFDVKTGNDRTLTFYFTN